MIQQGFSMHFLLTLIQYFVSKIGMEHRKLSQEEANRLFQTTFLLISQQNRAEKQKYLKNPSSPQFHSLDLSYNSPKKNEIIQLKHQTPQLMTLSRQINPQISPERQLSKTQSKWSLEKSSSNSEGIDRILNSCFDLQQKEQNSEDFNHQIKHQGRHHKNSSQPFVEPIQIESEMKQESLENLYVESMIKEIKRDLEIRSKGKICKSQQINSKTGQVTGYNFYCKNDNNCPFNCFLEYSGKRNTKNEKLYKLVIECENHIKNCIEEQEEIVFMKLTKVIDDMEKPIIDLLSQNAELKPKEILNSMAKRIGEENHKFIYNGLNSKNYHKAAKKYFDNLIYKIKNQMGTL